MPIEEVKRRFSTNYYWWSKEMLEQEIEKDFLFLKTIPSCKPVVDFFRQLSDQQQMVAMSAFIKRGHAEAADLLGEVITNDEAELLHNYLEFMRQAIAQTRDDDLKEVGRDFDFVTFTRNIEVELGPILGHLIESGGQLYRRYSREFKTFRIETMVHTGGRTPQLQYEHKLLAPGGLIREHISVLSWLGIISGTTYWKPLSDETSGIVIKTFKEVCSSFINAAPKLIEQRQATS